MEQTIKMEVKMERAEPRDENDPTPLRERVEESSPHASAFEADASVSKCGWDSDLEDIALPPTPGATLQATEPKDEFKMDPEQVLLDELLNDFRNIDKVMPKVKLEVCDPPPPPPPLPSSLSCPPSLPPPPPPNSSSLPPSNYVLDGIPSAYTARDNLEDMDLCSLGDADSDAELMSEKMEILRKLAIVNEVDKEGSDEHKKKKKSKKRKRSHRSGKDKEEEAESKKRPRNSSSPDECQKENKSSKGHHWPGRRIKPEKPDLDYVPVRAEEKRLRVVKASNLLESQAPKVVHRIENLSIHDKRQRGVARAKLALELFQKKANKEDDLEALMVDTMCMLPVHDSFRNQNGFENPSPLCNNMNVVYEFNSAPGTRIDLAKWGLEVLPHPIRKLCRILGIDIHRLKELQRTATPSQRILKLKQEQLEQGVGSEEAAADKATLYKNAATQTNCQTSTHEAGIQVRMEAPPRGSTFWQKPAFNATEMTQQQSNVMYALQELSKAIPDATMAETLYRSLGPALAISRHTSRQSN
ncbi:protein panoramix [Drosophila serrata]|uniref:protein panoramix n=1 Tax=Drosophila serrata TaxID=7274 RepID=UPI000A1D3225|nr:protein panoramix [Drosophila serrata]